MDLFSWFRHRRETPPGRALPPFAPDEVRIPLQVMPSIGFVVYFRLTADGRRPTESEMQAMADDWLERHASDPLCAILRQFLEQALVTPRVHDRGSVPDPPDDILRAYNPGEVEERRFRSATHVAMVGTPDLVLPPRAGLWAAVAVSRAIAEALPGGVIVDPEFPRLLTLDTLTQDLPPTGHLRVQDHILVPYSHEQQTGLLWMTTKGMGRFGLPDLEMRNVPPNLATPLLPVMNGVAQRLTDEAMRHVTAVGRREDADAPEVLPLPAEIPFDLNDIRRAYAHDNLESIAEFDTSDGEPWGETRLRMEVTPGRRDEPPLIRIAPPAGAPREAGIWLNAMLAELFGASVELAHTARGDRSVEAAHRQARDELPLVKARYRAGFRFGEVLHVKHGFPTADESREYMWLAVTRWEDDRLHGTLVNDPQYRHDLRSGQAVEIAEDQVYDWLIVHTDGQTEGGYTNRALDPGEDSDG